MSPAANKRAAVSDNGRAFRLNILPASNETYGLALEETYGQNGHTLATGVITTTAIQTTRVIDTVVTAVRNARHQPSILAFSRKKPIPLDEPSGVRLALILIATQPVTKHDRVRALVAGINAMSVEESYYWYAKCLGSEASNARKALRTLIVGDAHRGVRG
jgi:hypothetical protein